MKNRPKQVPGVTTVVKTPCGKMYVTVNHDDDGRAFEVFTRIGKAGGCASAQAEAIGRLVSIALRSGISPDRLAKQLIGIQCHLGSDATKSCADGVGQIMADVAGGGEVIELEIPLTEPFTDQIRSDLSGTPGLSVEIIPQEPFQVCGDCMVFAIVDAGTPPGEKKVSSIECAKRGGPAVWRGTDACAAFENANQTGRLTCGDCFQFTIVDPDVAVIRCEKATRLYEADRQVGRTSKACDGFIDPKE